MYKTCFRCSIDCKYLRMTSAANSWTVIHWLHLERTGSLRKNLNAVRLEFVPEPSALILKYHWEYCASLSSENHWAQTNTSNCTHEYTVSSGCEIFTFNKTSKHPFFQNSLHAYFLHLYSSCGDLNCTKPGSSTLNWARHRFYQRHDVRDKFPNNFLQFY